MGSDRGLPPGLDRLLELVGRIDRIEGSAAPTAIADRYRAVTAIDPDLLIEQANALAVVGDAVAAECAEGQAVGVHAEALWAGSAADAARQRWQEHLRDGWARTETVDAAAGVVDRCGRDIAERLAELRLRSDRADAGVPGADDPDTIDEIRAVADGAGAISPRACALLGIVDPIDPASAASSARRWLDTAFVPAVVEAADAVLGWCEATSAEIRHLLAAAGAALEAAGGTPPGGDPGPSGTVDRPGGVGGETGADVAGARPSDRAPAVGDPAAGNLPSGDYASGRTISAGAASDTPASEAAGSEPAASDAAGSEAPGSDAAGSGSSPSGHPESGEPAPNGSDGGGSERADIAALVGAGIELGVAVVECATAVVDAGTALVEAVTDAIAGSTDGSAAPEAFGARGFADDAATTPAAQPGSGADTAMAEPDRSLPGLDASGSPQAATDVPTAAQPLDPSAGPDGLDTSCAAPASDTPTGSAADQRPTAGTADTAEPTPIGGPAVGGRTPSDGAATAPEPAPSTAQVPAPSTAPMPEPATEPGPDGASARVPDDAPAPAPEPALDGIPAPTPLPAPDAPLGSERGELAQAGPLPVSAR